MNIANATGFVENLPRKLLLATVLLPVIGFSFGFSVILSTSPENTRLFLSALTGAQAGVLAIVFSVTVIGVQLIANRYSPRMISLFTEFPIFVYTFLLFVVSIAVDLGLLYTVPESQSRLHSGFVGAASGLGLTAAYALFIFVRTAIKQSTPEGAVDAFVSSITPNKYLHQVQASVETESETAHPMHPLYSLIMNALSNGERVTAERALHEYGRLTQDVLADFHENHVFSDEERQVVRGLFKSVLGEHLHDIALHAEEKEENRIATDAVEWQYKLGKDGLDFCLNTVAQQAQRGICHVIRDAPVESGSLIASNGAWRQISKFLVEACKKPRPRVVWSTTSSIDSGVSGQLWKVGDVHWYQHSMTELYRRLVDAQEHLLEHYEDDVACVQMEWQYEHVPDDIENSHEVEAVYGWRKALFSTTESFLQYIIDKDQYPITEGNFKNCWQDICIQASNSPAEDYATTLCQGLIEIAVIDRVYHDEDNLPWSSTIGRVKHKGNSSVVDNAFNRILKYSYVDGEPQPMFASEMEEWHETYYRNQLNVRDVPPLNTIADFKQIVGEIQDEADQQLKELSN